MKLDQARAMVDSVVAEASGPVSVSPGPRRVKHVRVKESCCSTLAPLAWSASAAGS